MLKEKYKEKKKGAKLRPDYETASFMNNDINCKCGIGGVGARKKANQKN